jgi:16S rRNA U516 pseudouridylate synthase RsuA-like enzyme
MPSERLQKIISAAGITSRRNAEKMIAGGLVSVNGQIVTELGSKADIERVPAAALKRFYEKYYQPDDAVLVVAGKFDEASALQTIQNTFGAIPRPTRVLDPSYTVEPVQDGERAVTLRRNGEIHSTDKIAANTCLIELDGERAVFHRGGLFERTFGDGVQRCRGRRLARVRRRRSGKQRVEVTLKEGRPPDWRMFEEIGHHVEKIKRVKYGPLVSTCPGEFRRLTLE